jgi:hypothetical protein
MEDCRALPESAVFVRQFQFARGLQGLIGPHLDVASALNCRRIVGPERVFNCNFGGLSVHAAPRSTEAHRWCRLAGGVVHGQVAD